MATVAGIDLRLEEYEAGSAFRITIEGHNAPEAVIEPVEGQLVEIYPQAGHRISPFVVAEGWGCVDDTLQSGDVSGDHHRVHIEVSTGIVVHAKCFGGISFDPGDRYSGMEPDTQTR